MICALIDDHVLLTESIGSLIKTNIENVEIRTYESGTAFVNAKHVIPPNIVITDLMIPDGINGIGIIEYCRVNFGEDLKILVLSSISDVQIIRQAIRSGANGFLTKISSIDELTEAIHTVMGGRQYIAKNLRDELINTIFTEDQVVFHLSPREKDILHRVCSGKTIKEIAYELKLSAHTVQYYHRSVMSKFKVKRTSDLIVFAMRHGLYIPDINNLNQK